MKINLLPIMNADGRQIRFDEKLDFSDRSDDNICFVSDVHIVGEFHTIGNSIELMANVSCDVEYNCDRCAEKYITKFDLNFEETLRKESVDTDELNPDIIYFTGYEIELDDIVYNNIFMNVPLKKLCKPDCMGLCQKCGQNLNYGKCDCDDHETDPRFDALDKFFE